MRHLLILFSLFLGLSSVLAQAPNAFAYQGVARDASGDAVANSTIGVQFQIHQGTVTGTVEYGETHITITNDHGLFSLEVGNGIRFTTPLKKIDWQNGPYYLEVGLDPAGGTSFTSVGTQQLLSVPYAMYAGDDGDWIQDSGTLIAGDKQVGIGTNYPAADLHVAGTLRYNDGMENDGRVLTSDVNGNASWKDPASELLFGSGGVPTPDFSCLTNGPISMVDPGDIPIDFTLIDQDLYVVTAGSNEIRKYGLVSAPISASDLEWSVAAGPFPTAVVANDDHAFVVDRQSDDLRVYEQQTGNMAGSVALGQSPFAIQVLGNYAYIIDNVSLDLRIIDISDPGLALPQVGLLSLGAGAVTAIAVEGSYAYVTDKIFDDLKVIDVSDPTNPQLVGSLALGGEGQQVAIQGGYAYVTSYDGGTNRKFSVIDISDPLVPVELGSVSWVVGDRYGLLEVQGSYAVATQLSGEAFVIDLHEPTSPVIVSTHSLQSGQVGQGLILDGDQLYYLSFDVTPGSIAQYPFMCEQIATIGYNFLDGTFDTAPILWEANGNDIVNTNNTNVAVNGGLDVLGNATVISDLMVEGDATVNGGLDVLGNASVISDLTVGLNVAVNGGLDVLGDATVISDLMVEGGATVNDFTKLGANAPAVKHKLLTGNLMNTTNTFIALSLSGILAEQIIAADVIVVFVDTLTLNTYRLPPQNFWRDYSWFTKEQDLVIQSPSPELIGSPYTVLITYME